mmetsp:Transcript_69327/g.129511  ORF Transcript_69327/g.129511 Transcript_69327/m.129511 type:complete len:207 (+) Transcript_69327:895-1515(+)
MPGCIVFRSWDDGDIAGEAVRLHAVVPCLVGTLIGEGCRGCCPRLVEEPAAVLARRHAAAGKVSSKPSLGMCATSTTCRWQPRTGSPTCSCTGTAAFCNSCLDKQAAMPSMRGAGAWPPRTGLALPPLKGLPRPPGPLPRSRLPTPRVGLPAPRTELPSAVCARPTTTSGDGRMQVGSWSAACCLPPFSDGLRSRTALLGTCLAAT